ncbi:hypothetical protein DYB26_005629 [Aphanomyces astaci]|uniref:EF-hand domain-containing protein n=1 Tax=Aphanomyces astaci TaxID=112090 RepID=A0A3R7BZF7_APHAT|nr:hypothetical protein DYB26_005629 [Aphanomyces astaci]
MAAAMEKFDFNGDGKVDFKEFQILNQQFPTLLYPVYRLQQSMKVHSMGESWWNRRATLLNDLKDLKENGDAAAIAASKAKDRRRKTRQNMGCLRYYLCPCRRSAYVVDDSGLTEDALIEEAKQREIEAQKQKLHDALAARARKDKKATHTEAADGRKILSKDERKERAKKRRQRDMKDLPSRK